MIIYHGDLHVYGVDVLEAPARILALFPVYGFHTGVVIQIRDRFSNVTSEFGELNYVFRQLGLAI